MPPPPKCTFYWNILVTSWSQCSNAKLQTVLNHWICLLVQVWVFSSVWEHTLFEISGSTPPLTCYPSRTWNLASTLNTCDGWMDGLWRLWPKVCCSWSWWQVWRACQMDLCAVQQHRFGHEKHVSTAWWHNIMLPSAVIKKRKEKERKRFYEATLKESRKKHPW